MEAYSAGLMSQSFWFIEFKKVVKLISDGKSQNEIKSACIEENLFGAVNAYRSKRIAGYLTNRAAALDAKEVQLFMESDPATQKLLNLIATGCFLSFCLMSIVKRLSWESQSWKPEMQISFSIIKKYRVPKLKRGKTQQRENFGAATSILWSMQICLRQMEKHAELRRRFWTSPWSGISRQKAIVL